MKLSVCIPVYNGEQYIEEAIDSVLNQNFSDFELIVVDNNSSDNTVQKVKVYKDKRIRLFQNVENIGLIPNWNKAVDLAQGEYIKILPADDLLYPDCLQLQCEVLDNDTDKSIGLVCGRRRIIDENGKILFERGFCKKGGEVPGIKAINKVIRRGASNIIGEPGTTMFRKEIINKTGLFNSPVFYTLDLHQYFKMLLLGNLYVLPQIVAGFRVSGSSASVQVVNNQQKDCTLFIKEIYSEEKYSVLWINYMIGILNTYVMVVAKKILYKYILTWKAKR